MDYSKFYIAARRYAKRRITRGEFCVDWSDAQRQQGIETGKTNGLKKAASK
jgi:hypothetical protein